MTQKTYIRIKPCDTHECNSFFSSTVQISHLIFLPRFILLQKFDLCEGIKRVLANPKFLCDIHLFSWTILVRSSFSFHPVYEALIFQSIFSPNYLCVGRIFHKLHLFNACHTFRDVQNVFLDRHKRQPNEVNAGKGSLFILVTYQYNTETYA